MLFEEKTANLEISFPESAKIKVKKGDQVEKGQTLAEYWRGDSYDFDLAKTLGLERSALAKVLRVGAGDEVEVGQTLAVSQKFFLRQKTFASPVSGEVAGVSEEGVLQIRAEDGKEEILAPAAGRVVRTEKGSLTLEFAALELSGRAGLGGVGAGELTRLGEQDVEVSFSDLTRSLESKVVAIAGKLTPAVWQKAQALGVAGIVCGSAAHQVEKSKSPSTPLLLVAENETIPKPIWKKLTSLEGKETIISGEEKKLLVPNIQ